MKGLNELKREVEELKALQQEIMYEVEKRKESNEYMITEEVRQWLISVDREIAGAEYQLSKSEKNDNLFRSFFDSMLGNQRKLREEMNARLHYLRANFQFQRPSLVKLYRRTITYSTSEEPESRKLMKDKIMAALRDDNVSIVGIYGAPGVGKTFLASQIANVIRDDESYNAVVHITVPAKSSNVENIILTAPQLNLLLEEPTTVVWAEGQLGKTIMLKKRVLILLDDVSEKIDFPRVGILLKEGYCKLLLISRDQHVLEENGTEVSYKLEVLGEADSWRLFQARVGPVMEGGMMHKIGIQLAKRCIGLPLAIVTMAASLRGRRYLSYWEEALRMLNQNNDHGDNMEEKNYSSILELSYNQLEDDEVKEVFLLCGVHGPSIHVSDLLKYVIGLGVFKHVTSFDDARRKLYKIIDKLKASSLVLDHDDDERGIQMHDIHRHFAKSVASKNGYAFKMERSRDWLEQDFLKGCCQIILEGKCVQDLPEKLDCPNLKLLRLDGTSNPTLIIPDSFFEGMVNLLVLHLIGIVIQFELSTSLISLTNLKVLCFYSCSVGHMTGIGGLTNLEILSFFCSSTKEFPEEIGLLANLRILDLSFFNTDDEVIRPNILSNLTALEELYVDSLKNYPEPSFDQLITNSMKKLGVIQVRRCPKLEHVFTFSKIKEISQLLDIEVSDCGRLKNIVSLDKSTTTTINEIVSIRVRSLFLRDLPNLHGSCWNSSESHDIQTIPWVVFRPLKHLKLTRIHRVLQLVVMAQSDGVTPLQNLETMEIVECSDIQNLFVIKGVQMLGNYGGLLLPHLSQLSLRRLSQLKSIVGLNHPRGILNLKMLKHLIIEGCDQLVGYVLPLYVLHNLQQLELIEIRECKMLERVFGDDDDEDTQTREYVQLPRVKSLILEDLPEIRGCSQVGHVVEWLSLKRVRVVRCPMIEESSLGRIDKVLLISVEVKDCHAWANHVDAESNIKYLFELNDTISEHDTLKIEHSEKLEKYMNFQPSSFSNLRILEAMYCNQELNTFLSSLFYWSNGLEELTIENCELLEQVFDLQDLDPPKDGSLIFPMLKTMKFCCLPKLKCIWNKYRRGMVELGKLVKLEIIECGLRKSALSTALLVELHQLKELKIESCAMIEHVIEDETEIPERTFTFTNLEELQLVSLPNLIKFNSGNCNYQFPTLLGLRIEKCPQMNEFITGFLRNKIPNEGTSNHMQSDANIDAWPRLQRLKLVGNETFEEIWPVRDYNETVEKFFPLKEVEVDSFSNLKYIITMSDCWIYSWERLETLVVKNCSSLIQLLEENTSDMIFSNLKIVRVKGCDSIKRLSLFPYSYPRLTEIDVSDCQSLKGIFVHTGKELKDRCFGDLKSIFLENLPILSTLSLETFEFPGLQNVRIANCPAITTFSSNVSAIDNNSMNTALSQSPEEVSPSQLADSIDLINMQLWNQEPHFPVYENLTSLKIIRCRSEKKLFSLSAFNQCFFLKLLTIYDCENVVQVLSRTSEDGSGRGIGNNQRLVFKKLETLVLKHLPSLTSFCEEEDVEYCEFPELKMVSVEDVPKMHTFMKNALSTPKLKQVHVTYVRKLWHGDLNQTIGYLHSNHEKFKEEVWKKTLGSPGNNYKNYADVAESSSQGMRRTSSSSLKEGEMDCCINASST